MRSRSVSFVQTEDFHRAADYPLAVMCYMISLVYLPVLHACLADCVAGYVVEPVESVHAKDH